MRKTKMIAEIIIISILAVAMVLASVLAIHNIYKLSDTQIRYNKAVRAQAALEDEVRKLRDENFELTRDLETERVNAKMLERALLDMIKPEPEESEDTVQASANNEPAISSSSEDVSQTTATKERLPEGHTNVISGMPYTTITDKKSEQWALQLQAFTGEYGIRCYSDGDRTYFLAAMGSAYGREIGTAFRVTLRCGTEFYVMLAEYKDDGTDPNFFGHPTTHADGYDVTCVLEFIYDKDSINSKALQAGNFCNIEYFGGLHGDGGDIAKIEYLGRRWEP